MVIDGGIGDAQSIWAALAAATRGRTAFTLGYLGTSGVGGQPHVRAIILREVDAEAGRVFFSTNALSAKVGQLEENPFVAVTFYDGDADVQLRLEGQARIVTDERIRRAAWASFGGGTRQLFASPLRPGSPLPRADAPSDGGSRGEAAAYARFAWVCVQVSSMDAIDLSAEQHLRRSFRRDGEGWNASRVVP